MKIGAYELTANEEATFRKRVEESSKEEMGKDLVLFSYSILDLEKERDALREENLELEQELEITEEINDDLRADLELKDKTIRSLVEVCRHLASRTV